ncbi:alpha/beta hydrolase [Cohnella panacarvi]|uniref:alpha/beta hydrolase n=1 Tax=Cohnella panacarvi TaxID=400776 RepID=UPI00047D6E18|nr:alpha/beta hydrolase [Cohnella panacarvi]
MVKQTHVYKRTAHCSIEADVYDNGPGTPVIMYLHSGALIFGTREWLAQEQIDFFGRAGFSIVNIDYRLAPETTIERIVEDVKDAIHWVKHEASGMYGFDSDAMALMGSSVGGYLSLLMGTMPDNVRPKAIVSLYGYGNIIGSWLSEPSAYYCSKQAVSEKEAAKTVGDRELTSGAWARFDYYVRCRQQGDWLTKVCGFDATRNQGRILPYNPISHVAPHYPPTIFLHGDQDTDVPYEQSVLMHDELRIHGVISKLVTIEGADHVFDQHFDKPDVRSAFEDIVAFLNKHVRA